jgi:hypothetical protein
MLCQSRGALAAGLFLVLLPAAAGAQDKGRAGVTMGYPGTVGVLWHVSENVALRPEFQFSYTSSESSTPDLGLSSSSHGWSIAPGASALFYLKRFDNLRTYLSPRFTFSRSTSSFESGSFGTAATSTNRSYGGSGSFGAQYSPGDRFSVFAEAGLGVTRTTGRSGQSSTRTSGHQWTLRTGVGAVLYF